MSGLAQGAVDSLLGRLTTVLIDEAQLLGLGGVRGDVEFIKDEMESMTSLFLHLTEAQQYREHHVRVWNCGCSRLSTSPETARASASSSTSSMPELMAPRGMGLLGYLRRILLWARAIPARRRIATRIRGLKVRARDLGDRRLRYGVTVPPAPPDRTIPDKPSPQTGGPDEEEDLRRRALLHGEPPDTVEEGTNKVIQWLSEEEKQDEEKEDGRQRPCVVSIVGPHDVGKTAIARRVYEHFSTASSFDCRVWINLEYIYKSSSEICRETLEHLLLPPAVIRLRKEGMETWDDRQLEQKVTEHLQGKRLLIVLDSSYSRNPPGFLANCSAGGVTIVTTTESFANNFASFGWRGLCREFHVLEFETLPRFFHSRALALGKCARWYAYVTEGDILKFLGACYPDALALQMFLHLLYINPNRTSSELGSLHESLLEHKRLKNNTVKKMLMFCYNELPTNYRSCLLYLSVFPQDHRIRRTSLLRRWVAEGLITERSIPSSLDQGRHGDGVSKLVDQAERSFDALVTRGFVRPGEISAAGKIKSCTVHHVVRDFIARDVNFMDTISPPDLAHHLSINSGIALQASRSDQPFDGILTLLESLPGSAQWQQLKVLDLEGCKGLKKKHMSNICMIVLLKYLSLRNTDVTELPKQIEKLQCLETLDIRQTTVWAFATKSVMLPMLKHLLAGHTDSPSKDCDRFEESFATVRLPGGILRMNNLEILSHVDVFYNVDDLIDVGELLQLRKLGVILHGKKASLGLLLQQIDKLHRCLRSLSIRINRPARSETSDAESVAALVSPPKLLQSLSFTGITGGLPHWIEQLDQLAKITLSKAHLRGNAIRVLGKLRTLRCLRLRHKSYTESELSFRVEEFQSLKFLFVEGTDITNISFDTRAAPKLERIVWSFTTMQSLSISGVDRLPMFKELELNGDCNIPDHLKQAFKVHPNRPVLKHKTYSQRQEAGGAGAAAAP